MLAKIINRLFHEKSTKPITIVLRITIAYHYGTSTSTTLIVLGTRN